MSTPPDSETLKAAVRETYGQIASGRTPAGCCSGSGCCSPAPRPTSDGIGYSDEERQSVPEGADLGLGCGNPKAIANLRAGERVLDLGSGAGFDAFLAARQVELPISIRDDLEAYAGCVAGAGQVPDLVRMLNEAGFKDVVVDVQESRERVQNTEQALRAGDFIASAWIRATKPLADQRRG